MNKQAEEGIPWLGTDPAFSLLCHEPGEWKGIAVTLYPFPRVSFIPLRAEGPELGWMGCPPCGICIAGAHQELVSVLLPSSSHPGKSNGE